MPNTQRLAQLFTVNEELWNNEREKAEQILADKIDEAVTQKSPDMKRVEGTEIRFADMTGKQSSPPPTGCLYIRAIASYARE